MTVNLQNRTSLNPVDRPRSTRVLDILVASSLPAGKFVPVEAISILREDAVRGTVGVEIAMGETYERLVNKPYLRLSAVFVPKLAEPRWRGNLGVLQDSYSGINQFGGAPLPYFEKAVLGAVSANAISRYLGLHYPATAQVNLAYHHATNIAWNWFARNRSSKIEERLLTDYSLPPAFWGDSQFSTVVPDIDTGLIMGTVPLMLTQPLARVTGIGHWGHVPGGPENTPVHETQFETGAGTTLYGKSLRASDETTKVAGDTNVRIQMHTDGITPQVFAQLGDHDFMLSMANMRQAAKLVAEARHRMKYEALPDDHIIDQLMAGLTVADQYLRQPMLVGQEVINLSQQLLPATDGASLGEKMAVGGGSGRLEFMVPQTSCGGTLMIFAEVLPVQLYEDQRDPGLFTVAVSELPDAYRDANLAAEGVEHVRGGDISVYHTQPDTLFGYWGVNGIWERHPKRFGGENHRTAGGANSTASRQMIWATELTDPTLTEDFYLVSDLGNSVFRNPDVDPFKIAMVGTASISGLTVLGSVIESEQNYDAVRDQNAPLDGSFGE